MGKNIINYKSHIYYKGNAGIGVTTSKKELLERLKSFEGMYIDHAEIKDNLNKSRKYFSLYIKIENAIETENSEMDSFVIEEKYKFTFVRQWNLYRNDDLVYDGDEIAKYESPKEYEKLFNRIKLLNADVDTEWTEATFVFDNKLKLVVKAEFDNYGMSSFFVISKQAEPLRMQMNFAEPEQIVYLNDVLTHNVSKRKDKFIPDDDFLKILNIATEESIIEPE